MTKKHTILTAINSKYIHSNLAVYCLRAYAKPYIDEVEIAEYTINQTMDDILSDIYRKKPDILCLSCYLWNILYVEQLITEIHKVLPKMQIWLGGPEVSYNAVSVMEQYPQVTGVMCGEGEETFLELMEYWNQERESLDTIKGIVYRENGTCRQNPPRPVMDLSKVPFVYDHIEDFQNKIIYYESSRGCPFSCSYCLSSIDKCLRFRNLELVKKELQFFIDHEVPQVKFVDRTFNCKHSHSMAIWTYLKEHDRGKTNFHFEVAADLLNEEEMELIASMRPGLIQLEIGIQSTNPETITEIRRKMNFEEVKRIVKRVQEKGNVHQHLDLIAGLPYEDYERFAQSFRDVYTFGPTFRAENSNTTRHAAEFWMIEPEMAFCDLKGDMDVAEAMIKHIIRTVMEKCPDEINFFNSFVDKGLKERLEHVASSDFGRVSYTEAVELLKQNNDKFDYKVEWGTDLQTEHERYLTEQIFKKPVFVTDYPKDIKAFYMRLNDDGKTVAACDCLVPGIGEIIGGSQREERLELLEGRIQELGMRPEDYWWYLDLRRYGGCKHAGFGLGFERCVMYLTGMSNIRDVIPFPRTVNNCEL